MNHRTQGLKKNLNYVMVEGITPQAATGEVRWKLRAPDEAGDYTLAAAFLYGTEKASPVGRGQVMPGIGLIPRGGFEGHSGRILFSGTRVVRVR